MTDENNNEPSIENSEVFDVAKIRELIELMKEHDLSEVDLMHKPRRIRLRRGAEPLAPVTYAAPPQVPAAAPAPAPVTESAEAAAPVDDANISVVKSPMVGTFYSKPKPDQPNYVKVGDQVEPDTVVCLIEAMKMFNDIPAGVSGTVVEVVAKNEDAVDVGRPLFKIKTA